MQRLGYRNSIKLSQWKLALTKSDLYKLFELVIQELIYLLISLNAVVSQRKLQLNHIYFYPFHYV